MEDFAPIINEDCDRSIQLMIFQLELWNFEEYNRNEKTKIQNFTSKASSLIVTMNQLPKVLTNQTEKEPNHELKGFKKIFRKSMLLFGAWNKKQAGSSLNYCSRLDPTSA